MTALIIPTCKIDVSTRRCPGAVSLVSPEDFQAISAFKWCLDKDGYAMRIQRNGREQKIVTMHRHIVAAAQGQEVDHANRVRLDNRRENLRLADRAKAAANQRTRAGRKFKGVVMERALIVAAIKVNSLRVRLGVFPTEEAAAMAYDDAALHYFGEFACLNFPRKFRNTKATAFKFRYWQGWFMEARIRRPYNRRLILAA